MRTPTVEKKVSDPFFFLFWLFLSENLSRRSRLSRTTSDPAQNSGKVQAKIAFFSVFRRKFWHNFVTPFSTFANIKGSLPTKSTTPDRLRCRTRTDGEDSRFWANSFFEHQHHQTKFFQKVLHPVLIYTPKEAHSRIFVTGGSVIP